MHQHAEPPAFTRKKRQSSSSIPARDCLPKGTRAQKPYTEPQIESAVSRIQRVTFGEKISTKSWTECAATITPVPSGYAIGSCNWVILVESKANGRPFKIGYIAASSSKKARHPWPMDINPLKGCDALILAQTAELSYKSLRAPEPPDEALQRVSKEVEGSLARGARVLLPVRPCGVVFDLLEYLPKYLRKHHSAAGSSSNRLSSSGLKDANGKPTRPPVRIEIRSTGLAQSLQNCTIASEWLGQAKREVAMRSANPFAFIDDIAASSRNHDGDSGKSMLTMTLEPEAKLENAVGDVVFFSPPSLRPDHISDSVCALSASSARTGSSSRFVVLFCEPVLPRGSTKLFKFPSNVLPKEMYIEPRLRLEEIGRLLRILKPQHLFVPSTLLAISDWKKNAGCPVSSFDRKSVAWGSLQAEHRVARVAPRLFEAMRNAANAEADRRRVASFKALVKERDGNVAIQKMDAYDQCGMHVQDKRLYGNLSVGKLVRELSSAGVVDARVERNRIILPTLGASVTISASGTRVSCNTIEHRKFLRKMISNLMLEF